jgi:hypothetical protein
MCVYADKLEWAFVVCLVLQRDGLRSRPKTCNVDLIDWDDHFLGLRFWGPTGDCDFEKESSDKLRKLHRVDARVPDYRGDTQRLPRFAKRNVFEWVVTLVRKIEAVLATIRVNAHPTWPTIICHRSAAIPIDTQSVTSTATGTHK